MKKNRSVVVKNALLGSVSIAILAIDAAPALAQIDEIIVTARKREESLQDVPVSVTAVSGAALENAAITGLNDLDRISPNLHFEANDRSKPLIYVRGIGTRQYDAGSDPSVGVFLDDVYLGRFGALDLDLVDVERVEVLRGPQGTLYGRNTIGGAISVVTKDPTEEFNAKLAAEVGKSDTPGDILWSVAGNVSGALPGDIGAGSLSVSHRDRLHSAERLGRARWQRKRLVRPLQRCVLADRFTGA